MRPRTELRYIHLSESDRGTPGTGNVHWDDVFRGLKDARYDGALVMESFAAVNEAIIGATALWRDVVGDPQRPGDRRPGLPARQGRRARAPGALGSAPDVARDDATCSASTWVPAP